MSGDTVHATGDAPRSRDEPHDGTFEGTRRRQLLAGLELEPVERLRWLERTMDELRRLRGKAAPPGHS